MGHSRANKPTVRFDDLGKLDLRVGVVLAAREHANADKLMVLQVDLGDHQRQVCVGLKHHYRPEALVGLQVIVAVNLEPRTMRGELSQGVVLTARAPTGDGTLAERVVIVSPQQSLPPGAGVA